MDDFVTAAQGLAPGELMSIEKGTIQSAPLLFDGHEITLSVGIHVEDAEVAQKNQEIVDAFKKTLTEKYGAETASWVFSPEQEEEALISGLNAGTIRQVAHQIEEASSQAAQAAQAAQAVQGDVSGKIVAQAFQEDESGDDVLSVNDSSETTEETDQEFSTDDLGNSIEEDGLGDNLFEGLDDLGKSLPSPSTGTTTSPASSESSSGSTGTKRKAAESSSSTKRRAAVPINEAEGRQIQELWASGKKYVEIGKILGRSPSTITTYLKRILALENKALQTGVVQQRL